MQGFKCLPYEIEFAICNLKNTTQLESLDNGNSRVWKSLPWWWWKMKKGQQHNCFSPDKRMQESTDRTEAPRTTQ